ncbi:MAG: hypothetical protein JXN60_00255 [Lentisphaerae bacterium]|nr:hypothetical protein [Lentisphaerota bacterium]
MSSERILVFASGIKKLQILLCAIVMVASTFGIAYGCRAALAQITYYRIKYIQPDISLRSVARRAEKAFERYPYNYYLCIFIAEKYYFERYDTYGNEIAERVEESAYWCDKGLSLNPYRSQLRRLKTRLLRRESLSKAIKYWRKFVEWDFWNPHHHAVLADLYIEAGDFEKAQESLAWVEDFEEYEGLLRDLYEAWKREMDMDTVEPLP